MKIESKIERNTCERWKPGQFVTLLVTSFNHNSCHGKCLNNEIVCSTGEGLNWQLQCFEHWYEQQSLLNTHLKFNRSVHVICFASRCCIDDERRRRKTSFFFSKFIDALFVEWEVCRCQQENEAKEEEEDESFRDGPMSHENEKKRKKWKSKLVIVAWSNSPTSPIVSIDGCSIGNFCQTESCNNVIVCFTFLCVFAQ